MWHIQTNKILIPTAGGQNSIEALKLSKDLTNQSKGSSIDVLFVESDVSDLSKEVGMKRLESILGKSGFDLKSEPFNLCVSFTQVFNAYVCNSPNFLMHQFQFLFGRDESSALVDGRFDLSLH